jgi:hypothetical protein
VKPSLLIVFLVASYPLTSAYGSSNDSYLKNLRAKYTHRIEYKNAQAASIVKQFNIDCKAKDGRFLPLTNVLLAKLREADREEMWLQTIVDGRSGEVRIYDYLKRKAGTATKPELIFEINKWGELVPHKIRTEALLNACYGTYGPIWEGGTDEQPDSAQAPPTPRPTLHTKVTRRPPATPAEIDACAKATAEAAILKFGPTEAKDQEALSPAIECEKLPDSNLRDALWKAKRMLKAQ